MPRAIRSKERYKVNWQLKRGLTRPIILRYQLAVYKERFILECVTATIRVEHSDYNLNPLLTVTRYEIAYGRVVGKCGVL